ncbi:MAG: hypothetical protein LH465_01145 [Sphingomonas bacterium]|nr:hypothetical protein [Sphingomonas bacterium]
MAEGLPLSALLPDRLDGVAERVKGQLCENEQVGGMDLAWDFIGKEIHGALSSVLDCDLIGVLAKGWAEAAALSDYADPAKHPPGERSVVELGEHDFSREFEPVIGVTVASCPCVELRFTFALTAHVGGVKLAILDGHVTGGELGESWASAELSYAGVPLHPKTETNKLAIPGAFTFDAPGIPIPRIPSLTKSGA